MPITALPTPPSRSDDPTNFSNKADALLGALPTFVTQANLLEENVNQKEFTASQKAAEALASQLSAASSAQVAASAANFKGIWSTLSGAINKPACVKHNGRFWMLLNNLTNIASSEPGVSVDWTSLDTGVISQTINSNTTAIAGVYYIPTTSGITLNIPSGFLEGDKISGRNLSNGECFITWGSNTVMYQTPESPMRWPKMGKFETIYNGATFS